MIDVRTRHRVAQIVLRPNCSASWQTNRRIIALVFGINLLFASGFIAVGAWLVLPFMGLELTLLWWLLRRVFSRLQYQQTLRFDDNAVTIENGFLTPSQRWHWPRADATVLVTTQPHPWDPLHISLAHAGEEVALGRFLSRDDSENLLATLREHGLAVRQFSSTGEFVA